MLSFARFSRLASLPSFRPFAIQKVYLPDLGEGTKEATVKEMFVKPGQSIEEFDDLCEVFTDKLVAPIPSSYAGTVTSVNFDVDEVVQVGSVLFEIDVPDGAVASSEPETTSEPVAS